MHAEAYEWVARYATGDPLRVLDIGGRNINGTVRDLFPAADYTTLDILDDRGVDIVADAATWTPDRPYDLVVCCEVFEHTYVWPRICTTAYFACAPGGVFIATTAGPGRAPHSAYDGGRIRDGEYYANIEPAELQLALNTAGFTRITIDQAGEDVRAHAVREPRPWN